MNEIANVIGELDRQKAAIERALEALRGVDDSLTSTGSTGGARGGRKGRMSPEARRRMSLGMKRRWAAKRAGTQTKQPAAKKRGLTAAGRRKLAEAMRRRWAAKRTAAQAKRLTA